MDLLLINPPWTFYPGTNRRLAGPPSTIATVAAAFSHMGLDVRVLDCMACDDTEQNGDRLQCGLPYSAIVDAIAEAKPKAVGISATWTAQFSNALLALRAAREALGDVSVMAGGHDATVRPQAYLDAGFDGVLTGELENAAHLAWERMATRRWGIVRGSVVNDLSALPLPAWEALPLEFYLAAQRPHHGSILKGGVPVITSRGCPYKCNFCTVRLSMGRKWRGCSPEYVLRHLTHLDALGFRRFHFEDDNLTCDRNRWIHVMEGMVGRGWEWDTPNGVRLDHLDHDFLELAARAGCREIRVAPESANPETVNGVIGKNLQMGGFEEIAQWCRSLGIRLCAFWVIGIPGETMADIRHTLGYAERMEAEHGVVPRVSIATPFPGTDMARECEERGWLEAPLTPENLASATHGRGLIRTPEFAPEQVADTFHDWNRKRGYGA